MSRNKTINMQIKARVACPCLVIPASTHKTAKINHHNCLRPYHVENASSRPITEAKQRRAQLVLGWVTAWEYWVLQTFDYFPFLQLKVMLHSLPYHQYELLEVNFFGLSTPPPFLTLPPSIIPKRQHMQACFLQQKRRQKERFLSR